MRNLALTVALALSGALLLADTPDYATLKFYDRMVVSDGATGTGGQLVNTGYLPNGKTLLKAKYNITATTTPEGKAFNQCLYCARKGTNRTASNPDFTFFLEVRTASNGSRIDYYDKTFPCGTEMAAKAGVDTELTVDNGSGTLRVGANEYKVTTVAWPEQGASTANPLCLFSSYGDSPEKSVAAGANITFYWLKIYEKTDGETKLVHRYVPARAEGSDEVYLADTVEQKVFANVSGKAEQFSIPADAVEYAVYPDDEPPVEPEPEPGVEAGPYYVSPSGSDEADGLSPEAPKATLEGVLQALGNNYGTVYLLPGTYAPASEIVFDRAIRVIGCPTANEPVIIDGQGKLCPMTLDHADSLLQSVTVQNGQTSSSHLLGACVFVGENGGTVADCLIRDGKATGAWNASGGCLAMKAGHVTRCVVTGGYCGSSETEPANHGAGVYMSGGVMDNSLICGNTTMETIGEVVYLSGDAVIVNCTVVKNKGALCGGVYLANSATSKACNCAIYGNEIFDADPERDFNRVWRLNDKRFFNCAGDAEMAGGNGFVMLAASPFEGFESGDYRPYPGSPLVNAGLSTVVGVDFSLVDLAGRRRPLGRAIDIGCYETLPAGAVLVIR